MKRSKKIFLIIAAIFLIILMIIGYDISTRTDWPGAKKDFREDKIQEDSARETEMPLSSGEQ